MELVTVQKLDDGSAYDYAIRLNEKSNKAVRNFDIFAQIVGNFKRKEYVIATDTWLIQAEDLERLRQLDAKLFPPKRKLGDKIAGRFQTQTKEVTGWESMGADMKLQPYPYQKEIIKFCLDTENSLVVAPCGAGKTPCLIGLYLEAVKAGKITGPGMVVVKASLKLQWASEVKKFSNLRPRIIKTATQATSSVRQAIKKAEHEMLKADDVERMKLTARVKNLKATAKEAFEEQFKNCDLYIVNYETLLDENVRKALRKIKPQFVGGDEIHYIKSASAKRSKFLCEFADARIKAGFTATPIKRDPSDLYGLFKFIKPELFVSKARFSSLYLRTDRATGRVIGTKNEKQLSGKIDPYMIVKTKEEVAKQLPKLVVTQRYAEFSPSQAEMHQLLMEELDEVNDQQKTLLFHKYGSSPDPNVVKKDPDYQKLDARAMALQTYMLELADSPLLLTSEGAKKYMPKDKTSYKLELFIELLTQIVESGEKAAVFTRWTRMHDIITERVLKERALKNIGLAYHSGQLTAKKRDGEIRRFRTDPDTKLLLMSNSGAEGLNLSECQYLFEMEPAESYAIQTQRHGRIERADATHDTAYAIQLLTADSWDEKALKGISRKEGYDATIIKGEDILLGNR